MSKKITNQIIIRITEGVYDAEVLLINDDLTIEKVIPTKQVYELFKTVGHEYKDNKRIDIFELHKQNILSIKELGAITKYYVLFLERNIKCTYRGTGYSITHPNSIFVLYVSDNKVRNAEVFAIKEFKGIDTELFLYPLPNQLSGHSMCLGTVEKEFINCENAILNIIESNYTHENGSFKLEKKKTGDELFKWLSSLEAFPYHTLIPVGKKLENILEGNHNVY